MAGLLLVTLVSLKNLNPLSAELKPVPSGSLGYISFCKPSTNISSLTENGAVENPKIGVTKVHVTIPDVES